MIPYCDTPRQSAAFGLTAGLMAGLISLGAGLSFLPMLAIAAGLALLFEAGGHAGVIEIGIDEKADETNSEP